MSTTEPTAAAAATPLPPSEPIAVDDSAPASSPYAHLIPLLLIVVTALTFGRVINNGFAPFDDELTIRDNPRLNPAQFTPDSIGWYWKNSYMSLYAPLTYTVWGTVAQVSGVPTGEPGVFRIDAPNFHIASLVLHIASVLLVFVILRRLLGGRAWPAAAGALLYGLHPVQVEAVAWASGLKDVLSGCLSLAAIALYLHAVTPAHKMPDPAFDGQNRIHPLFYGLALACFALAMLAKPSAMMTPLLLAIIDLALLRRPADRVGQSLGPWLALAIPIALIAKTVQPGDGVPFVEFWQRPIVAGASLAFYLQKLVFPHGLAFEYGWRPLLMLQKTWFYAIAVVPLLLAVLLLLGRRRWPALGRDCPHFRRRASARAGLRALHVPGAFDRRRSLPLPRDARAGTGAGMGAHACHPKAPDRRRGTRRRATHRPRHPLRHATRLLA